MDIKELKRELSKVSGIDFFGPKYRAIFKKYGGDEKATDADEVEDAKAVDSETDSTVVTKADEVAEDIAENCADDNADKKPDYAETDKDKTKPEPTTEETAEMSAEASAEPEVATEEQAVLPATEMGDELLTTKLELELVRAGIREDRLETAKRLFMPEFKSSGGNTQQIKELIAQYPEWVGKQGGSQGFGMPLGDKTDALTNEEKALKRMGINPRE